MFSAPELGNSALEAFNKFGQDRHTCDLAAILLVDRKQQHIIRSALLGPRRILLAMPLKVRELRAALLKLLIFNGHGTFNLIRNGRMQCGLSQLAIYMDVQLH